MIAPAPEVLLETVDRLLDENEDPNHHQLRPRGPSSSGPGSRECGPGGLERIPGGRNNRVYRVRAHDFEFIVKRYSSHPDARRRGERELGFLRFCEEHRIEFAPKLLGANLDRGVILLEDVCGERFRPGQIEQAHVDAASAFFRALNRHVSSNAARSLKPGKEACFSTSAHKRQVEARLERLEEILPQGAVDEAALRFVTEELRPRYEEVSAELADDESELPRAQRCLSPSDFGFHNALLDQRETIRFFDFEYAGWDEPAKVVGDFFHQPAVPVPMRLRDRFVNTLIEGDPRPDETRNRIDRLFPLYQVKWCTILLNEFLPEGAARRSYARGAEVCDEDRWEQLEHARDRLERSSQ